MQINSKYTSKKTKLTDPTDNLTLPTQKSEPVKTLSECTILLYGEMKIGKTSLASQFPNSLFLMFEPGGKGLSIYKRQVENWLQFKKYVQLITETDNNFTTIVIDTVDLAYEQCYEYTCNEQGVENAQEGEWGSVWKAIKNEFQSEILKIINSGRGMIFISHAADKEFQTRAGFKYNKLVPSMSKQSLRLMRAMVDIIAYYGYYSDERLLTIRGSDSLDAGDRLKYKFKTKDGKKIHSIPMGNNEEEAYENLLKAFNNEQKDTYEPEYSAELTELPVRSKKR